MEERSPHHAWGPTMTSRDVPGCLCHGGSQEGTAGLGWSRAPLSPPAPLVQHEAACDSATLGTNQCRETSCESRGTQRGSATRWGRDGGAGLGGTLESLQ